MSAPTRVAGQGVGHDGSDVTWTVAEGRKGRRWREVISVGSAVVHALLLETDGHGRFTHLELARVDGLWTLHPEPDRTLHGNHVGRGEGGIRHFVGLSFEHEDVFIVEGSPISLAAAVYPRRASIIGGSSEDVPGVVVRVAGELDQVDSIHIERLSQTRWRVADGTPFEVDETGLPVLQGGQTRPLELG